MESLGSLVHSTCLSQSGCRKYGDTCILCIGWWCLKQFSCCRATAVSWVMIMMLTTTTGLLASLPISSIADALAAFRSKGDTMRRRPLFSSHTHNEEQAGKDMLTSCQFMPIHQNENVDLRNTPKKTNRRAWTFSSKSGVSLPFPRWKAKLVIGWPSGPCAQLLGQRDTYLVWVLLSGKRIAIVCSTKFDQFFWNVCDAYCSRKHCKGFFRKISWTLTLLHLHTLEHWHFYTYTWTLTLLRLHLNTYTSILTMAQKYPSESLFVSVSIPV